MSAHVSVVIPVYNGEEYLEQCLQSVLDQSYADWDCAIVDNCSTDRSGEIAHAFADRDPRFRVIDADEFLGQIENINRAIATAQPDADYVKPLFADDHLFPRCLEEMVAAGERNPTAAIVSAFRLEETHVSCDGLPPAREFFDGREVCRRSLRDGVFVFGSASSLLFRGEVVRSRQPFYQIDCFHEDTEACYEILADHDLAFVPQVLTFTRRENESVTSGLREIDSAYRLDRLATVLHYGPRFLPEEEFASTRREAERKYYRFLGERTLYATDARFWQVHHGELARAGASIDRGRLWRARAAALLRQAANPAEFMARIVRILRRMLGIGVMPSGMDTPAARKGPR